jgi:curved DNA-binding protein CbpA
MIYTKVINLYNILGVSNTASQAEIRQSFRNLALKYHPDKNKNSEEARQKFMQIVEAYEILSDKQARRNYDDSNIYYYGSYDNNTRRGSKWTSADFDRIYNYAKSRYRDSPVSGRTNTRYIAKTTTAEIKKAPLILFGGLASFIRFVTTTVTTTSSQE